MVPLYLGLTFRLQTEDIVPLKYLRIGVGVVLAVEVLGLITAVILGVLGLVTSTLPWLAGALLVGSLIYVGINMSFYITTAIIGISAEQAKKRSQPSIQKQHPNHLGTKH